MKKLMMGSLFVFGLYMGSILTPSASATGVGISPKATATLNYTTTASTISATISTLYEVTLATGASGEFVAFFDTNTAINGGTAVSSGSTTNLKTRIYFSSTTQNTQVRFDPPLIFFYGIQVVDSASTGQSMITWEPGMGSGQ